jgi:hypothetical protein
MIGWALLVVLTLSPQICVFSRGAQDMPLAPRDVVLAFAGELRSGQRITVRLMDNQKLKGEFAGVQDTRLLFRPDRDRTRATLLIPSRAIHSIEVHRGGAIVRP